MVDGVGPFLSFQGQGAAMLPEDLGRNCARLLLEEIYRVCPQLLQVWERSTWKQFPCIFIRNFLSLSRASVKELTSSYLLDSSALTSLVG